MHIDRVPESAYHKDFIWNVNIILNNDYEGGYFLINDNQYKLEEGSIYYYKSDTSHGVSKILGGNRYVFLYHIRERDIRKQKSAI